MLTIQQLKENLLILKNRSGLTAYQIAQNAGMKENTVYSAFNPLIKRWLRLDTYMKICDGMGASYEEAFKVHQTKDQTDRELEGFNYFASIKNEDYKRLAVADLKHIYEEDLRKCKEQEEIEKKKTARTARKRKKN